MDAGAIAIHEDHAARRRTEGTDDDDPTLRRWTLLDEDFKDSNRQQADHHELKLRALSVIAATRRSPRPGADASLFAHGRGRQLPAACAGR